MLLVIKLEGGYFFKDNPRNDTEIGEGFNLRLEVLLDMCPTHSFSNANHSNIQDDNPSPPSDHLALRKAMH